MELNDAFRRIIGGHRLIVAAGLLLGLTLALIVQRVDGLAVGSGGEAVCGTTALRLALGGATHYSATSRVILDTTNPSGVTGASALADSAKAVVTSPSHVATALIKARVHRDPAVVAACDVSLSALGSSGVLSLSVKDADPAAAAAIANALVADLIATRLDMVRGQAPQLVADLDTQIQGLQTRIANLDGQIDALVTASRSAPAVSTNPRVAGGQAAAAAAAAANVANSLTGLRAQRNDMAQEKVTLQGEREGLLAAGALPAKPLVIDPATAPTRPDPSGRGQNLALGALLGLVLGIGLAAILETFRPSIIGRRALSGAFGVPVLGELHFKPERA